jgi:DNA-directed RNA polymerase specialized sigma24 family protein
MPRREAQFRGWLASVVTRQLATWWRKNARHEGTWSLDVTPTGNGEPHEWAVGEPDAGYQVIEYWEIRFSNGNCRT